MPSLPTQRLDDDELRRVVHGNAIAARTSTGRASRCSTMRKLSLRSPIARRTSCGRRWCFAMPDALGLSAARRRIGRHRRHVRRRASRSPRHSAASAVSARRRTGFRAVLVTFRPHPLEVVNPSAAPMLLTPDDEQLEALADSGPLLVVVLPFTPALAAVQRGDVRRARAARPLSHARARHRLRPRARSRARRATPRRSRSLARGAAFDVDVVAADARRDAAPRSRRARSGRRSPTAISSRAERLAGPTVRLPRHGRSRRAARSRARLSDDEHRACRRRENFSRPKGYTPFARRWRAARSAE